MGRVIDCILGIIQAVFATICAIAIVYVLAHYLIKYW